MSDKYEPNSADPIRHGRANPSHFSVRRDLVLAAVAWIALPWAGVARAQAPKNSPRPARVGIVTSLASTGKRIGTERFVEPLRELGWIEGRNVVYDRVYAEGDESRLPELAKALVARTPDLILVNTNPELRAILAATRSIPVVVSSVNDPVENGFVASLARPGGNVTGVAALGPEYGSKRMQLLKEALPNMTRVGVLRSKRILRELEHIERAAGAGIKVTSAIADDPGEFDAAFGLLAQQRVEALLLTQMSFIGSRVVRKRILDFAAKQRIPVVGQRSEIVDDGALMSYSSTLQEQIRRAMQLADKVLKGSKPADIPLELPTKFELVLNLKAAKALGLSIAHSVLIQATRVIE